MCPDMCRVWTVFPRRSWLPISSLPTPVCVLLELKMPFTHLMWLIPHNKPERYKAFSMSFYREEHIQKRANNLLKITLRLSIRANLQTRDGLCLRFHVLVSWGIREARNGHINYSFYKRWANIYWASMLSLSLGRHGVDSWVVLTYCLSAQPLGNGPQRIL